MVSGRGDLVLRLDTAKRGRAVIVWLVAVGLVTTGVVVGAGPAGGLFPGTIAVVGIAVIWGHFRCGRIAVTHHEIAVLGLLVRRRRQRARAVRVVRATVVPVRGPITDIVFVLDAAGKTVIRINGHNYRRADVDRLVDFLSLPWSAPDGPVTANELSTMHPGMVPWREVHPYVFGLYVAVGTVAAIIIAAVITAGVVR